MKWIACVAMSVGALSLSNCRKQEDEHKVPQVAVNIGIDLNLAQYNDLNFIGGWAYVGGGYNGILVYRQTQDVFNAYDRQAPYNIADLCRITVDSTNTFCNDTCSGSQWLLYDGQVSEGPASYPLRQYTTFVEGTRLNITN